MADRKILCDRATLLVVSHSNVLKPKSEDEWQVMHIHIGDDLGEIYRFLLQVIR